MVSEDDEPVIEHSFEEEAIQEMAENPPKPAVKQPKPLALESNMAVAWKKWLNSYEWYAKAHQVAKQPAEVQSAIFMSVIGPEVEQIYKGFRLTTAEENDVKVIQQRFAAYFEPKGNDVYEGYCLRKILQKEDEKFFDFVTRLKVQAEKCHYDTLTDRMILEQLVIGIKWEKMKEKILTIPDISLKDAEEMCQAYELAISQKKDMSKGPEESATAVVIDEIQRNSGTASKEFKCQRCGRIHGVRNCPAFNQPCRRCGTLGHFRIGCKKGKVKVQSLTGDSEEQADGQEDEICEFKICEVSVSTKNNAWTQVVKCKNKEFVVKIDTGAECSVVNAKVLTDLKIQEIKRSKVKKLVTYNGGEIPVLGEVTLPCVIEGNSVDIKFQVIQKFCTPVIDGNVAERANLIKRLNTIEVPNEVFTGLGCLKDFEYEIDLVDDPKFSICPARTVPFALQNAVRKELQNMEEMQVIKKCSKATDSVSPLVIVRKNGKLRLCIDLTSVNKNIKRRHFPLATVEEIAARVTGSKCFTILDCTRGFWQIKMGPKSQDLLTFATPWGRYSCLRLPFGLASAPEIFQMVMTEMFKDMHGVEVSMDDILIHAKDEETLDSLTKAVIDKLMSNGLKLNRDKCVFNKKEVKFLGHLLSSEGLKVDPSKVEAIHNLKEPGELKELQRLLGMLNYLSKFIDHFSDLTAPLRMLLKKDVTFSWGPEQRKALEAIKKCLTSSPTLKLYDVNENVVLSVDSSSKAFGAVLLQRGQPVAYATKALTESEQLWPQIEKEAGAIRFALKKFHDYVWGKTIIVESDHKPLESIFKKNIVSAPPRLKRILHDVKPYDPEIVYKRGIDIPIADTLSRDVVANVEEESDEERVEVNVILALTKEAENRFKKATAADVQLQLLKKFIDQGWPVNSKKVPVEIRHYFAFKEELSHVDGILFKGDRCIVPASERKKTLEGLHQGHVGLNQSIRRAKDYFYWPGITKDTSEMVESCNICQSNQNLRPKEKLLMKEVPDLAFEIVSSDLFTYKGHEYVLIADSFSGYYDFRQLRSINTDSVMDFFKEKFSEHGVPRQLHTDGGPQFTSRQFQEFAKDWGFEHCVSSPYFPRSNGHAERYVQTAKCLLKKCDESNQDVRLALLLARNTPGEHLQAVTERIFGRRTRTPYTVKSSMLKPKLAEDTSQKLKALRERQKQYADRGAREYPKFPDGSRVRVKDQHGNWCTGDVVDMATDRSYNVKLDDGREVRRNGKFMAPTKVKISMGPPDEPEPPSHVRSNDDYPMSETVEDLASPLSSSYETAEEVTPPPPDGMVRTRYGRVVRPPVRLNL